METRKGHLTGHWTFVKESVLQALRYKSIFILVAAGLALVAGTPYLFGAAIESTAVLLLVSILGTIMMVFLSCAGALLLKGKHTLLGAILKTLQRAGALIGLFVIYFLLEKVVTLPIVLQVSFNYPDSDMIQFLLLLVALGILLYSMTLPYVFIHENLTAYQALKKSFSYVHGRWGKVATRVLVFSLIAGAVFGILFVLALLVGYMTGWELFIILTLFLITTGAIAITISFFQLLYDDLKRTAPRETKQTKSEAKRYALLLIILTVTIFSSALLLINKGEITVQEYFLPDDEG